MNDSGFGGLLGGILSDAADIGKVYLQGTQQKPVKVTVAVAPKTNWVPWAIGGGVALVVLVVLVSMSGRRK